MVQVFKVIQEQAQTLHPEGEEGVATGETGGPDLVTTPDAGGGAEFLCQNK